MIHPHKANCAVYVHPKGLDLCSEGEEQSSFHRFLSCSSPCHLGVFPFLTLCFLEGTLFTLVERDTNRAVTMWESPSVDWRLGMRTTACCAKVSEPKRLRPASARLTRRLLRTKCSGGQLAQESASAMKAGQNALS